MDFCTIFGGYAFLGIFSSAYSASCSTSTRFMSPSVGSTKIITSPNYPSNYPTPSTTCKWRIAAPSGYRVQIKFTNFYTYGSGSCSTYTNDYLEVFDTYYGQSSKRLGRYCGSSLPPILVSSDKYMYLTFSTKSLSPGKGFKLEYSPVDKQYCGSSSITANSTTTKILTTLNYPYNYPLSTSCQWTITAPSVYVVQIKFTNFSTYGSSYGSCSSSIYHNLYIYDSSYALSSKLLGKYCGSYLPANVVSSGSIMLLKFPTSYLMSKTGFRIEYKAVKNPPEDYSICSPFNSYSTNNNIKLKASSSYKYIKSPYYPNKYPSNIQCTWIISASSSSKRVKLTLTDVKMHNYYSSCSIGDSLTIRDGSSSYSSLLKQLCDKSYSSTTVTSTRQKMWILFKTNSNNYFTGTQAGFQVKFIEVEDSSSNVGMIVGIIIGVMIFIGLIVCCVCVSKRKGYTGHVQSNAAATSVQTTTTTTHQPPPVAPQYPLHQVGPKPPGNYPPPGGGYLSPRGGYPVPQAWGFPPPTGGYQAPTESYPPPGGSYPQQPQSGYPPSATEYPPGYPPPGNSYSQQPPPPYLASDVLDIPPPQYPGPPAYPAQVNEAYNPQFQGGQPNPPYPPPQGSENQAAVAYPPSQDTKASAPPLC